jgi:hypothetical protein
VPCGYHDSLPAVIEHCEKLLAERLEPGPIFQTDTHVIRAHDVHAESLHARIVYRHEGEYGGPRGGDIHAPTVQASEIDAHDIHARVSEADTLYVHDLH